MARPLVSAYACTRISSARDIMKFFSSPTLPPSTAQLIGIAGLRASGVFPTELAPSLATLRAWTNEGHLPHYRVGRRIFYDATEIREHIRAKLRVAPTPAVTFRVSGLVEHRAGNAPAIPQLRANVSRPFRIIDFINRCGVRSFRVTGHLNGERVRRNFKTQELAETARRVLEAQRLDFLGGMRIAVTRLSDEQLKDAETAFALLGDNPSLCLLEHVRHSLKQHARSPESMRLGEAIDGYLELKRKENERGALSVAALWAIERAMQRVRISLPNRLLREIDRADILPLLDQGQPSLKTYNNRRSLLFNFFKYAVREGWASENPVEKTPFHRVNHLRGSAKAISANLAADVMGYVEHYAGGCLVPYFSLCLFAGIRPCFKSGEISKLQPTSVLLETNTIHIEPVVSKVRMKRVITIQPNLARWLTAFPLDRCAIVPPSLPNHHYHIFQKFGLGHDCLRHTFISMFVSRFRSIGEAALQSGNSEDVIRKYYLDLKSSSEADRFFSIVPRTEAGALPSPEKLH